MCQVPAHNAILRIQVPITVLHQSSIPFLLVADWHEERGSNCRKHSWYALTVRSVQTLPGKLGQAWLRGAQDLRGKESRQRMTKCKQYPDMIRKAVRICQVKGPSWNINDIWNQLKDTGSLTLHPIQGSILPNSSLVKAKEAQRPPLWSNDAALAHFQFMFNHFSIIFQWILEHSHPAFDARFVQVFRVDYFGSKASLAQCGTQDCTMAMALDYPWLGIWNILKWSHWC